MTAPARPLALAPVVVPAAAAARAAAGHSPSVLTIVLLIAVIAGALAVTYDLSAHGPARGARNQPEPPAAPPPGDGQPAAGPAQEQP
jgi:hypothetical protein